MLETFQPLIDAAADLDLQDTKGAEQALNERWDPNGEPAEALKSALLALLQEGRIADRGEMPLMWGRVTQAKPETKGFSIDVVHMEGPGPRHRHPKGEIDYCIALEGSPTFDGRAPGWVVLPPESRHIPTVEGGRMLIVYLLPDGEIDFG